MDKFIELAKREIIKDYNKGVIEESDKGHVNDIFVVWSCKTLQNKKAILSSKLQYFPLYEFTWNGDKNEGYLDCYFKFNNVLVKGEK